MHLSTITWLKATNSTATPSPEALQDGSSYDIMTIILVFALCLIMIVGTIGNASVCYFFGWKLRGGRSIPDKLFLYLGIVDLISSILNPGVYLYFELTRYKRWDFGIIGCKVLVPFGPISTLMSASFIQIIAIDRYFVIVKPFGRTYDIRCINISVLAAIALSIASYLYYILILTVPPGKTCIVEDASDKRYSIPVVVFLLLQDIIYILIIVFTNTAIYLELRKKDALSKSETGGEQSNKRKRKLFRMLMIMSLVFIFLILPKDLFQLSFTFSWMDAVGIKYDYNLVQINTILKILYTSNSCVNVFIYSKMHSRFRVSQKSLVSKCIQCFHRPSMGRRLSLQLAPSRNMETGASNTKTSKLSPDHSDERKRLHSESSIWLHKETWEAYFYGYKLLVLWTCSKNNAIK